MGIIEVAGRQQGYAERVWQRNDFYGTASKEETLIVEAGASTRDQSRRKEEQREGAAASQAAPIVDLTLRRTYKARKESQTRDS